MKLVHVNMAKHQDILLKQELVQLVMVQVLKVTNNYKIKNGVKQKVSFRFCIEYYLVKRILFFIIVARVL